MPGWRAMEKLVQELKASSPKLALKDQRIEQTMLKVDRKHYCPGSEPYRDAPVPIGYNATISAPHMHVQALEHLKDNLFDGARVLDVGSGSGYLTACMAHMVGSTGKVFGVEHIKELLEISRENIMRDCPDLLSSGRIELIHSDGRIGLAEQAPFDAIHVGALAENFPDELFKQLKEGGRLVSPIEDEIGVQHFERIEKLPGGEMRREKLFAVRYIPLTDVLSQLGRS